MKLSIVFFLMALLMLNGCALNATHDFIEGVKDVGETYSKREQLILDKEDVEFLTDINTIYVKYIESDLDEGTSKTPKYKATYFCNEYKDNNSIKDLVESGKPVFKCVTDLPLDTGNVIQLTIIEKRHHTGGIWLNQAWEASYVSIADGEVFHTVDRDRETMPKFVSLVSGLTATMIALKES